MCKNFATKWLAFWLATLGGKSSTSVCYQCLLRDTTSIGHMHSVLLQILIFLFSFLFLMLGVLIFLIKPLYKKVNLN